MPDNDRLNNDRLKKWIHTLMAHGVRMTPQREAILKYLAQARTHPTAAEVYEAVRREFPHVARATVYNTLNLLVRLGLIIELRREDGAVRYETDLAPHINLICISCGRVEDVHLEEEEEIPSSRVMLAIQDRGFRVLYTRVDVYGLCRECRLKDEDASLH
ncbi:MAG: transcriptional repressor [Chloroflexi bacterium]|nr:transcriptional repressor [Chloroflexota bacterium]